MDGCRHGRRQNPVIGQQAAGYLLRPWEVVERANFGLIIASGGSSTGSLCRLGGSGDAEEGGQSAALVVERNGGGLVRGLVTSQDGVENAANQRRLFAAVHHSCRLLWCHVTAWSPS